MVIKSEEAEREVQSDHPDICLIHTSKHIPVVNQFIEVVIAEVNKMFYWLCNKLIIYFICREKML